MTPAPDVPPPALLLLGKPDCHLCHEMRTVAGRVARTLGLVLEERDVREHPEWERRYLWEIPVLLWGDRELARHRTSEVELRALLALGPVEGGA